MLRFDNVGKKRTEIMGSKLKLALSPYDVGWKPNLLKEAVRISFVCTSAEGHIFLIISIHKL
jgi:hypothetical protein